MEKEPISINPDALLTDLAIILIIWTATRWICDILWHSEYWPVACLALLTGKYITDLTK
jgi:hypothetical protein